MQASTPTSSKLKRISIGTRSPLHRQVESSSRTLPKDDGKMPNTPEVDPAGGGGSSEAEVTGAWANQLAAVLDLNQDLEDKIVSLRQQNMSLRRYRCLLQHLLHVWCYSRTDSCMCGATPGLTAANVQDKFISWAAYGTLALSLACRQQLSVVFVR